MINEKCKEFITALYGRYFESNKGLIELRMVPEGSGATFSKCYSYDVFKDDGIYKKISEWNETHHILLGVNPRPLSGEKKQDDIKNIICLWADIDDKNFGGKRSASENSLKTFPVKPSMVIDSGHGLHVYWILKEPIIDISNDERLHLKQILSGMAGILEADKQVIPLSACLRLPGTVNIKYDEKIDCNISQFNTHLNNDLKVFEQFINTNYHEPEPADIDFSFGKKKTVPIRRESQEEAFADIDKLDIPDDKKRLIKTGTLFKNDTTRDGTKSGRDITIINSLISWDYNYETIESIFLNPYLGCSNRIMEKEKPAFGKLHWDINNALNFVKKEAENLTAEQTEYRRLKYEKKKLRQIKLGRCANYVAKNLISDTPPIGEYFKNDSEKERYYFDKKNKNLMDIEATDFECHTRLRFGIQTDDWTEVKKTVRDSIWQTGKEIESHNAFYYDQKKSTLYISNYANGIYRPRDGKIELLDNGADGIFFKPNTDYAPFELIENSKTLDYFDNGFDIDKFFSGGSYLKKYLMDITNFAETERGITPIEQQVLLLIYFYSIFFDSIMGEKPIACVVGNKESGKSTIGSLMGKILFGDKFLCTHCPNDKKNLETIIGNKTFVVLDNVDQSLSSEIMNSLCVAATGGLIEVRKYYTTNELIKTTPHCFIMITTREANFKRDDLVSRLLLFRTDPLVSLISQGKFFRDILEHRNAIMTEVFTNLNSIIALLKKHRNWNPYCTFRVADWETFGRKIAGEEFRSILTNLNEDKALFALSDDPLIPVLEQQVNVNKCSFPNINANDWLPMLESVAIQLKIKEFTIRYSNASQLGKRLSTISTELKSMFDFSIYKRIGHPALYSIDRLGSNKDNDSAIAIAAATVGHIEADAVNMDEEETEIENAEWLRTLERLTPGCGKN